MKNILVVDDSPTMRRMIISSLRDIPGLQFEQAESGLDAIEKLTLFRFDLVVLDLNMPDMHGMEVLQFVRKHQIYDNVTVAVVTTKSDEISRMQAMDGGASLFINKPYNPSVFADDIKNLLKM